MSKSKGITVDVIIPTYNGLPYLKEAIKSVLIQTYGDLVLYVVDDGSTDGTADYVRSLKDTRIKYLRKKNGGPNSARNLGVKRSSSKYLAFLDSDDVWEPEKLKKQLGLITENTELGMVYGFQHTIDENGREVGWLEIEKRGWLFGDLLSGNCIAGSGSMVLIRREVFEKVGLFREDLLIGEDWEMWLRIAKEYKIDYVPEYLANVRVHARSAQKNYLKVADGLKYMLPVVLGEFELSSRQRNRFILGVLLGAAINYRLARAYRKSVLTLLEVFRLNPGALLYFKKWLTYISLLFGIELDTIVKKRIRRVKEFLDKR